MSSSVAVDARREALVSVSSLSSPPILRAQQDALLRLCLQKSHLAPPPPLPAGSATSADADADAGAGAGADSEATPLEGPPLALQAPRLSEPLSPLTSASPRSARAQRHSLPDSFPLAASPASSPSLGSRKLPLRSPVGPTGAAKALTNSPVQANREYGGGSPGVGLKKGLEGALSTPVLELALERIDISDDKDTGVPDAAPLHPPPRQAPAGKGSEAKAVFQYHKDVVEVVGGEGDYASKLMAKVPFPKGSIVAKIEGSTKGVPKRYTSVQCGCNEHLELNSDLVFINHSCDPNVLMDVDGMQVRAVKDIPAGQELTFFYPSTEWEMQQPFACWCRADQCVGLVSGAKNLTVVQLSGYYLSEHIGDLVAASLKYASSHKDKAA